ncbi:hypothetical protein F8568_001420 [Actinomadura sp. LD22]|uniref:Uncharacterized protein n=1 Tax=Actinomadura physcomitrii TaxID=2650748 RepID=A0A6I4LZN0_9ACTN|nr:hypothetical protein [Actinomadura physcomitrii]MVZ99067.1 hypothetical protein [Actinomadura physcomitrii]
MPDPDDAVAAALDAYQRELLPGDLPSHHADPSLAEALVQSLLEQLARYSARHGQDIGDTLEELHQRSLDRSTDDTDQVHNFRLGAQVQIRQQETATGAAPRYPRWRGFITSLTQTPGGDARCTVRVPAVADTVHVTASELQPADAFLPIATRTTGVITHARDAEETIVALTAWLECNADRAPAGYQDRLDDLARLSEALAAWSGGHPEKIARHLPPPVPQPTRPTDIAAAVPPGPSPVARLAATGFPQGPTPIRPDAPRAVPKPPDRSERRPRRL